jgi:hypothetical protein
MMTSQGGSQSFATPLKKNDDEPPGLSSFSTFEEGKKQIDDNELRRFVVISYI